MVRSTNKTSPDEVRSSLQVKAGFPGPLSSRPGQIYRDGRYTQRAFETFKMILWTWHKVRINNYKITITSNHKFVNGNYIYLIHLLKYNNYIHLKSRDGRYSACELILEHNVFRNAIHKP